MLQSKENANNKSNRFFINHNFGILRRDALIKHLTKLAQEAIKFIKNFH